MVVRLQRAGNNLPSTFDLFHDGIQSYMCDLNTGLMNNDQDYYYRQLTNLVDSCNLTKLPLERPHHT
ncbi:hypothetical protein J6590_089652 [Homalodisca vitripennis]|nr:hypothetical protein J6590_089652 [Homalodisca vitripennis]